MTDYFEGETLEQNSFQEGGKMPLKEEMLECRGEMTSYLKYVTP